MVNRYARGFQDDRWDDESSISLTNEALERAAAAERKIELEIALEHDEHPLHDEEELETEEEEASLTSEKRLKREIRAEAVRRLEEAARTEADFSVVIKEWAQAGPEPGAPGTELRTPSGRLATGLSGCFRTQTDSQVDE